MQRPPPKLGEPPDGPPQCRAVDGVGPQARVSFSSALDGYWVATDGGPAHGSRRGRRCRGSTGGRAVEQQAGRRWVMIFKARVQESISTVLQNAFLEG